MFKHTLSFMTSAAECMLWNLRLLRKNLRFYLGLFSGLSICFFLTEKIIAYAKIFGTKVQVFEPFIFSFADGDSVLFASLALLLPLSQIPRLDAAASTLHFRNGKKSRVAGQVMTVMVISLLYSFFLLLVTCLLTLGNVSFVNKWSDTAQVMSFAPYQFDVALEVVRRTVKYTVPGTCCLVIFILTALYMLMLSLLNLFVSLILGKRSGMNAVLIFSFIVYLLTPDRFMVWLNIPDDKFRYIANLASVWVSPLKHCTYTMHTFGYDRLPTFTQSFLLMGSLCLILLILCLLLTRRLTFIFHQGEAHD